MCRLNRALCYFLLYREDVRRLLAAYTKEKGEIGLDIAFAEYSSNWGSEPVQETIRRTAVDIGTDYLFLVPVLSAIYLHAANARFGELLSVSLHTSTE